MKEVRNLVSILLSFSFFLTIVSPSYALRKGVITVTPTEVEPGKSITISGKGLEPNRILDLAVMGGSCSGTTCGIRQFTRTDIKGDFPAKTYGMWPPDRAGTIYKVKVMSGGEDASNEIGVTLTKGPATPGTLSPGDDCTYNFQGCPNNALCKPDYVSYPPGSRYVCGGAGDATPTPIPPSPPCAPGRFVGGKCEAVDTGLGIAIETEPTRFVKSIFGIILSLSGGVALLLIILSGYKLMLSQGNPEKAQEAKETLTAAIVGLLFIIFSLVILQVIGVDILKIPGFQ